LRGLGRRWGGAGLGGRRWAATLAVVGVLTATLAVVRKFLP